MDSRENPDLIKLKLIKVMRRKIFFACVALVVSAAAVVGVKAYNYYSMPELMKANLEALSQSEGTKSYGPAYLFECKAHATMHVMCTSQNLIPCVQTAH